MSFSDKLKSSQSSGSTAPKLDIAKQVEIKEVEGGGVSFVTYDKEKEANVDIPNPIIGILIGEAMQMVSYSDNLGARGGNYRSSYYFTKEDHIALFAPSPKGYEVACKGTTAEVEDFIAKNSTSVVKKKRVLFVLTSEGLVAVTTNLIIDIDQRKAMADSLRTHMVVLHATVYAEGQTNISKRALAFLGKFIKKNPPKFAQMSVGDPITDGIWNQWDGDRYADEFLAFKKYKVLDDGKTAQPVADQPAPVRQITEADIPSDDLPF